MGYREGHGMKPAPLVMTVLLPFALLHDSTFVHALPPRQTKRDRPSEQRR